MKKILLILVFVTLIVAGWFWLRPVQSNESRLQADKIKTTIIKKRHTKRHNTYNSQVSGIIRAEESVLENNQTSNDIPVEETNTVPHDIEGVIPDEYILSFYSDSDREKFIRLAESMGAEILDRMVLGNSIRLKADANTLRKLRDQAPISVDFTRNREMNNPNLPLLNPEAPQGTYNIFGNGVLAWMGVNDNAQWGKGVKIAILDSGINNHPALANSNISLLDMLGGNGYDLAIGHAHGTSVASLIAGNNTLMRGISPAADILGIRVIDQNGKGDLFSVAKGIMAAVDAGANIINLSMGTRSDSYLLRDAVHYAAEHGVIIVAATGNDSSYGISFPAGYDSVVAVPAVDAAGRHLYFSNRGDAADIAAPGLGINAAGADNTMVPFSGTSASTPLISGAIAAIMSENPELSAVEALEILIYYSNDGGKPGPDDELGAGIIDMRRVTERNEDGIYDIAVTTPYLTTFEDGGDVELVVTLQNRGTEEIANVKLIVNIDGARYSTYFQNIPVARTASDSFRIPSSSLEITGNLDVEVEAILVGGSDTYPENNYLRINVYFELPKP